MRLLFDSRRPYGRQWAVSISWANTPTHANLTNALRKGLGRAHIWAADGKAAADTLFEACVNDYRFDRQVERPRGDWLWQILVSASLAARFSGELLAALSRIEESHAEFQLCQFARHYARAGDERFRIELRRIVETKRVIETPSLGEVELIRLDGSQGFLLAVRRHGADLQSRDWDGFDDVLVDDGIKYLGEQHIHESLVSEANQNEHVRRFRDAWIAEQRKRAARGQAPPSDLTSQYSPDQVIASAESPAKGSPFFRRWGRVAAECDLQTVFERMLQTTDVEALRRYLQVFARRPCPRFDSRFLQLCVHADSCHSFVACTGLLAVGMSAALMGIYSPEVVFRSRVARSRPINRSRNTVWYLSEFNQEAVSIGRMFASK
jgi:hypothetical protein